MTIKQASPLQNITALVQMLVRDGAISETIMFMPDGSFENRMTVREALDLAEDELNRVSLSGEEGEQK